ncbi:MAG: c-type cytochrome [Gaiellaceae bacterium]
MRRPLALALTALALAVPAGLTACGGGEEITATPETVEGELPEPATTAETTETETTETEPTETEPTETEPTETEPTETVEGDAAAGEGVWASAGCGGCHTLEAAGSSGNVGPDLDDSQPDAALTADRVTNGMGAMPAFEDQLSDKQIADVVAYVVDSTSG